MTKQSRSADKRRSMFDRSLVLPAVRGSFRKLNPRHLLRSPVMLVTEAGAALVTLFTVLAVVEGRTFSFELQISLWLWFTVLFANFAEALAEAQGSARAASLRRSRQDLTAHRRLGDGHVETESAATLGRGDVVLVVDGETIPGDGEIVEGTALVDESAITGESAPVVREAGGDRSGVTGGSRVLSGRIAVRITANPGETFLDRMIAMVEGARRQMTPNEVALQILLVGLTILFVVVVLSLPAMAHYMGVAIAVPILVSLLVCLMPTTIGGLLPAIGIAGMDRLVQRNVIAMSGRAVEASGDVDTVVLDKTGTITLGNRLATEFLPAPGVSREELLDAALLSSLPDETPEGRSIVVLCKNERGIKGADIRAPQEAIFVPFSATTRMSGVDVGARRVRKGAIDAMEALVRGLGGYFPEAVKAQVDAVARNGDTPIVVTDGSRVLGVVRLKDVLKQGIKSRLAELRQMGIRSVMITGDNPLTAASIAAEAGLDDFVAQAKPDAKLGLIRKYQEGGHLVAMIGDGTNDAPALAQADVAVAMNAGTQAAREAANMIDLDSNPTKLLDIVEVGKEILITRGALTTFSVANDMAKYFAIVPAIFAAAYPELGVLNIMRLSSPESAVLAAVIFNALIIPALIPLALRGVHFRARSASAVLRWNLLVYGVGGLLLPFVGIKLLDLLLVALRWA
ncbi:MAG: potassium-transporting ATPase subunit KdpB [Thermotogota bacterium]